MRNQPPKLIDRARGMRKASTDAERRIWSRLRRNQLEGFKFRRQRPINRYVLDFYCDLAKLAVELDGSQHLNEEEIRYDRRRTNYLKSLGIEVIRFNDVDVMKHSDAVLDGILEAVLARVEQLGVRPSPLPSPGGRGG